MLITPFEMLLAMPCMPANDGLADQKVLVANG